MRRSMKLPNPRKLSLEEQWSLYKLLEKSLPENIDIPWVDLLKYILHNISDTRLVLVLNLMYGKHHTYEAALDFATQLSKGLRMNDFVSFVKFVRGMANGKSSNR